MNDIGYRNTHEEIRTGRSRTSKPDARVRRDGLPSDSSHRKTGVIWRPSLLSIVVPGAIERCCDVAAVPAAIGVGLGAIR